MKSCRCFQIDVVTTLIWQHILLFNCWPSRSLSLLLVIIPSFLLSMRCIRLTKHTESQWVPKKCLLSSVKKHTHKHTTHTHKYMILQHIYKYICHYKQAQNWAFICLPNTMLTFYKMTSILFNMQRLFTTKCVCDWVQGGNTDTQSVYAVEEEDLHHETSYGDTTIVAHILSLILLIFETKGLTHNLRGLWYKQNKERKIWTEEEDVNHESNYSDTTITSRLCRSLSFCSGTHSC